MKNYYYDTAIEDGTSSKGLRDAPYRESERRKECRFADIELGVTLPILLQGPITRTQIVKYAGASYDFNPIHHDEEFAKNSLSGGIIAHGMMVMGYLGKSVTSFLGTGQFDSFKSRNVAMTRPGDILRIEGRVEEKRSGANGGGTLRISLTAKHNDTDALLCTGEVICTLK